MFYCRTIEIRKTDTLWEWCDVNAHNTNNLYNASLFRIRQAMTAKKKNISDLSENELSVLKEIKDAEPVMRHKLPAGILNYEFLDELFKRTDNPDYRALPAKVAQHTIKHAVRDMKSFFEAMKAWKKNPSMFNGKPELPRYKHKGGICSFDTDYQDVIIRRNRKGHFVAKLPMTKEVLSVGKKHPGNLKELHVTPINGIYRISLVFDDGRETPSLKEPRRICSIDPGVDNLMAVVNNCGLPSLLFKGLALKSVNQNYNRRISELVSRQTSKTKKKFVPTDDYYRITRKRNNQIHDFLLKCAFILITWCVENRIDTIVFGKNDNWKKNVNIGHKNNQTFVQIPHSELIRILQYSCERRGIRFVVREEAFSSKASFLDNDPIPEYCEGKHYSFSGRRIKRGLFRSKDGHVINADLNGAANIMRKQYPELIDECPRFEDIIVIRHPDIVLADKRNPDKTGQGFVDSLFGGKESLKETTPD